MFGLLATIAAALVWLGWMIRAGLMGARMYQIEEYEGLRLLAWGRQRAWLAPSATLAGAALALVIGLVGRLEFSVVTWRVAAGLAWMAGATLALALWRPLPAKKALVYTQRMRRILGVAAALGVILGALLVWALLTAPDGLAPLGGAVILLASPFAVLPSLLAANWLLQPIEARIQAGFIKRARAKYLRLAPLPIGVAGSYGKTSTKYILASLLQPAMETLPTPKSYNTLLGVTRSINEFLEPRHRAFVVEMDAYAVGEIAAMCRLVDPTVALYELVAALPAGAPAVIYGGEALSAGLADRAAAAGYRVARYGMEGDDAGPLDVIASEVTVDDRATRFTWRWPAEGLEQRVAIPLLGQHNILNVSAALAVVHLLGLPVDEAARDALRLEPAPHRLQLIPSPGGMTIIDDSYNANPVGVHNGLEVLRQMRGRHKILVTPGMVELGAVEQAENRRFGEHAAAVCDEVILVGAQQTQPIAEGLRAGGLPAERLHVVNSLEEVTATLARIAGPGDVALFANDLPDTYLALN